MTGPCHCCRPDRATPSHPGRRRPADSTRLAFDVPFACLVSSPLAATTVPHARVRHTRPTLGVCEDLEPAPPDVTSCVESPPEAPRHPVFRVDARDRRSTSDP